MSAARALAGNDLPPDVAAKTDEVASGTNKKKLREMLEEAKELAEEDERVESYRLAEIAAQARVEARRKMFEPYERFGISESDPGPVEEGKAPGWIEEPASPEQIAWLKKNRLAAKDVTSGMVYRLQSKAREWYDQGKATFKQRQSLRSAGAPEDVSFPMASRLIDAWHANKMKTLPPETIANIIAQRIPGEDG